MRTRNLLMAMATLAMFPAVSSAQTNPECSGIMLRTKAVAIAPATLYGVTDFSGSGGLLDPTPILQTNIDVVGSHQRTECVVVTFSTQATPLDNSIVFQASIDDVPMQGHAASFYPTPIVWDPEETNLNLARMLSYTFFASVTPGTHTVKIKVAGCCTANPTTTVVVNAGTVIVRY